MTLHQPVIRGHTWIRCVESEVVIRDGDGAVWAHSHHWIKRLPVQRRNVQRRLIDPNGRGPCEATIGRHGEGDIVVLKIAETAILPNRIEVAFVVRSK